MINDVYKKGLAAVAVIAAIGIAFTMGRSSGRDQDLTVGDTNTELKESADAGSIASEGGEEVPETITVDVDGQVNMPGVYELEQGSRVNDAIQAAGGLSEGADTRHVNKAKVLSDGEKIYIGAEGEEVIAKSDATSNSMININTATKESLMTLDGIGEVYSQRIIDYRQQKKFKSIEEIKNVKGIGDKTFEKIKDSITVD